MTTLALLGAGLVAVGLACSFSACGRAYVTGNVMLGAGGALLGWAAA